jgi:VWFA-related protein
MSVARSPWKALLGLCLAAAASVPALSAETEPSLETAFGETAEVTAVEIPIQVLLDGKPVRGLTAADFVVYQEKEKQALTGFDVVDLYGAPEKAVPATPAGDIPPPARRHFLFLFDLSFSEPKAILQAREAAKGLLDELHPSDVVAVASYAASRGPELVLGFTPDRSQVRAAIDTLGLPELIDRTQVDPLRVVVESLKQELQTLTTGTDAAASGQNRAGMVEFLLEEYKRILVESERATNEVQKGKISAFSRSFTDLARLMRGISGRKYVVYLSEGYDSSVLTGTSDEKTLEDMQDFRERGTIWKVDSEKRFGSSIVAAQVDAMLQELRRADCAVQAVDIGGLRSTQGSRDALGYQRQGGKESLFQLAHDTGGDLYENFNDLGAAMGQMLERTGVTYLLTIQPTQPAMPADGSWHDLRVELKNGPRGARLVHRAGYYAPVPFAKRSRAERMMAAAGEVLLGKEGGVVRLSVEAAPASAPPGSATASTTADIPVRIEIDGPSLLHLHKGGDLPTEIYVYVVDEQGRVRDFLAQTLSLDLLKLERRLLDSGLRYYGHLELPPGRYRARVLVRNGRTGFHGLKVLPVEVPPLAGLAAGTAGAAGVPVADTAGPWLVVREAPRPGRREMSFPARPSQPVP